MTGLLYKELVQNKKLLLILLLFVYPLLWGVAVGFILTSDREPHIAFFTTCLSEMAMFYLLETIKINLLRVDESHRWTDWVIASPKAESGYVYAKYLLIFSMNIAAVVLCIWTDLAITSFLTGEYGIGAAVPMLLCCGNLFLAALELPLMFRFSARLGEQIHACLFLGVVFLAMVYALFGDLSMFGTTEGFLEWVFAQWKQIQDGNVPGWMTLLLGLFPCGSLGLYAGSYFLSCKLYRKGAMYHET